MASSSDAGRHIQQVRVDLDTTASPCYNNGIGGGDKMKVICKECGVKFKSYSPIAQRCQECKRKLNRERMAAWRKKRREKK